VTGRHAWLEVTPRCNARCRYCYNVWRAPGGGYAAAEPSRAGLETVLGAVLDRLEPEILTFSGGEPLLRDDLEALALLARRRRSALEIQLTTNGTLFTRKRAAALRQAGISHALIPLLSDRRETQAELMGLDTFDDACRALLNARAAGMAACAVFVATRRNLPEMAGAFRTALALGVDEWMFLRFLPGGTGLANRAVLLPDPEALVDALAEADRLGARAGLPVTCGEPLPPDWLAGRHLPWVRFARCGAGSARLAVDPSGRVRPCEQDPKVLGNVLDPAFRAPPVSAPACAGCHLVDPVAA
jgi:pyrroloquinoline quinone biosynthesis protein E